MPRRPSSWPRLVAPAVAALLMSAACRTSAPAPPDRTLPGAADSGTPIEAKRWVEDTLAGLSLAEKAAQLVLVQAVGFHLHPDSARYRDLAAEVGDLGVGGIVASTSDLDSLPLLLDRLQAEAEVPLLVGADFERGVAFRIRRGPTDLPSAMAIGAAIGAEDDATLAEAAGEITAREARELGVHWLFAPVADVNVDPANPVIGTRAFGEHPDRVADAVAAFVRGARAGGALTTAKHFPGHGDTAVDSHRDLPILAADRERLEQVELAPFRAAIRAGVDAVMLGHLSVPALDPTGTPASLSRAITTDLLRGALGFDGLIATDALEMRGLAAVRPGKRAVEALRAGADVLLMPVDAGLAIEAIVRATRDGVLDEARIDASVRRLLAAKASLGLHRGRQLGPRPVRAGVGRPADSRIARQVAEASITVVRNGGDVLPLRAESRPALLHLTLTSGLRSPLDVTVDDALLDRGLPVERLLAAPGVAATDADAIVEAAAGASHVIVSVYASARSGLSDSQVGLLERLRTLGKPLVVIALDSPYVLAQVPWAEVFVASYGIAGPSQEATARVLLGEIPARGQLPVTLAADAAAGHGLRLGAHVMTLRSKALPAGTFAALDLLLDDFVNQGAFPGGVLAVGHGGGLVHVRPFGRLSQDADAPAVRADTIYDLASLTKVIATTTMAMMLVDRGRIALDMPIADFLPGFAGPDKDAVTLRHLLSHSSGIDWWAPLYKELEGKEAYRRHIEAMDLVDAPGERALYSDLGMILLGEALERAAGMPIDRFSQENIFQPLGMIDTGYRPAPEMHHRIAPTENDPWRGRILRGEVHDENAFALGGVAPHAGLFGTAPDLARFAQMMLWHGVYDHHRLVDPATIDRFTRPAGVPDSTRALGWDTKSPTGSSAGRWFSPSSFGHTGYTGTSLWIDPERDLFVILLTNRVHPSRENTMIRQVRPAVADAVVEALGLVPEAASSDARAHGGGTGVATGLERVAGGETELLEGKRLGLLLHAASRVPDGRHAIAVFRQQGLDVVRLFAPEHGLMGKLAAGEKVSDVRDMQSGVDVISLYGTRQKPSADDLAGLDALVVDLQDAGVRFYTYVSTLILCLEAAAEHGVEVVVLDRPNPLGGERIEGPVSAPRGVVPASLVNMAPGPLVHGLTLGEMARYVNGRLEPPARLSVLPMRGWKRSMTWADTGLSWVAPSPNLRSARAAMAYPGVALLEATNISEGRGSPAPFLYLGAPWLRPEPAQNALATVAAPGFTLDAGFFEVRGSPAAPRPKYVGMRAYGLKVRINDLRHAAPYHLGVSLLSVLKDRHGFRWRDDGKALTRLVGTPRLLEALREGKTVEEIVALDKADHARWREEREAALLYW